jgi:hypothetical protein
MTVSPEQRAEITRQLARLDFNEHDERINTRGNVERVSEKRDQTIAIRVTPTESAQIRQAAEQAGVTLTDFLLHAALGRPPRSSSLEDRVSALEQRVQALER